MKNLEKLENTVIIVVMAIILVLGFNQAKKGFEDIHISIPEVETTCAEEAFTKVTILMQAESMKQ